MENQDNEKINFDFLSEEDVQKSFADLHSCLLSGKHICIDDYTFFSLLEKYERDWKFFYRSLYAMNLVGNVFDRHTYFYLDFFDSDKGKLGEQSRSHQLTEIQTINRLPMQNGRFVWWLSLRNFHGK